MCWSRTSLSTEQAPKYMKDINMRNTNSRALNIIANSRKAHNLGTRLDPLTIFRTGFLPFPGSPFDEANKVLESSSAQSRSSPTTIFRRLRV